MNYKKAPLAVGLATAVATLVPMPAALAQSSFAIEEIVVTARKRSENLQEVPIAISAIDEATIERAGIERAADYIGLIPNVTIVDTANVGDTQVSIRGIVSTRDAESTFAYVVDGVLSTNPNSFNEELFDVQQIEVLKGPQGALYGRNAVAGAILVTTKAPTNEVEAKIGGGIANNDAYKVNAMVSGPIIEDVLLGRLAISTRETDGFYKNIFTGEDDSVDYLEDTSIRARTIWNVSDDLTLDFRAGYSEVKGGAINFNATFAVPQFSAILPGNSPTYFQDVNDADFKFTFNTPGENEQETMDFAIKADWNLGFADLIASASYNNLEEYLLSDGTAASFYGYEVTPSCQTDRETLNSFATPELFGDLFAPFAVFPPPTDFAGIYGPYTATSCDGFQYQERNQEDFSIDARLESPGDQDIRWIAGVYFADIEREQIVSYGADQGQGYRRTPYVDPTGPNPTDLLFWDDFDTTVYAIYGQLDFDLSDTMELAFALRYDREEREVNNKVPNVANSGLNVNLLDANGQPAPINPAFNSNPDGIPDRDDTYSQLQPKLTWSWAATDEMNVYASYGVGFRSGGFNSVGTEDLLNFWFNAGYGGPGEAVDAQLIVKDDYDKEVSEAFEIGLKSEWMDRRLRLNAAVFHTDVEDNQFFEFFAGPFGLLRSVTTIDELYVRGVEADFTFLATEGLALYGGIGLMDSEIERNKNRPLSEGNDVPQAPDVTGNLGVEWVFPVTGNMNLVSRLDWQYTGEMWFHTLQGEQTPTIWNAFFGPGFNQDFSKSSRDAYDTLDLRVGLEGNNWMVTAWGRNITDEEYLQEVIPAPEFGGSFNHPSGKRSYGLDFSYRF
ncbi:MAG: TonB-dependent receptor [Halioglobus sp.]